MSTESHRADSRVGLTIDATCTNAILKGCGITVVVVAFSVVVQGSLASYVAHRTGVPLRTVEPEPWALSMRFRHKRADYRNEFDL